MPIFTFTLPDYSVMQNFLPQGTQRAQGKILKYTVNDFPASPRNLNDFLFFKQLFFPLRPLRFHACLFVF
jgi:hypothetical protein